MIRSLILGLLAFALSPVAASAACLGPNPSVTHVGVQTRGSNGKVNTYRLVGTVRNLGTSGQPANVLQFVDIYDRTTGQKLDSRGIPPLTSGGSYNFSYDWLRAPEAAAGSSTLTFKMDVVQGTNCNPADSNFTLSF